MNKSEYEDYFYYLLGRSLLSNLYRRHFLYPRLCQFLRGKVLDIGCGIGDFLKYRANSIGIDINPRIVDYCRIRGLNVQLCSEGDYPFKDDSFNGAIMDNVLEHIVDPLPTLAEIKRVLISGSTLIVGVPGSRGFMSDPDHKISYDEKSMATTLYSEGFILTRVIHAPFKSAFFDRHMRQYCIYGVFHLQ